MSARFAKSTLVALALLLCPVEQAAASAYILDPIITFEGGVRQHTVRIQNGGSGPLTCRISVVNLRQMPDGSYVPVEVPEETDKFADKFVRISPRQVTIMAGAQQAVRVSLRLPPDLPPGQYRSYLRVEELPQPVDSTAQVGVGVTLVHHLPIRINH